MRPRPQPLQRFGGPEGVQHLGRFALRLVVVARFGDPRQQRSECIGELSGRHGRHRRLRHRSAEASRSIGANIVRLLDHSVEDESIAVPRYRADEAGLARVVAERPADRADGLAQRTVRDDNVLPDVIEEIAPMHRFVPVLDEVHEEVEIAGDESQLDALARQRPAPRRNDELTEPITGHNFGRSKTIIDRAFLAEVGMLKALRLAVAIVAVSTLPTIAQQNTSQLVNLHHWSGQGVAPVYEGFDINPDGSFNMWFGYMNRNYEEELDIQIGPDNTFEPGGDRGQPTHFVTRRHKDVFKVTVPKDFGNQTLVWKLTSHGRTDQVAATLKPVWQIDRLRTTRGGNSENVSSNLPPDAKVFVAKRDDATATLTVMATDDGLPKRRGESVGSMTVLW